MKSDIAGLSRTASSTESVREPKVAPVSTSPTAHPTRLPRCWRTARPDGPASRGEASARPGRAGAGPLRRRGGHRAGRRARPAARPRAGTARAATTSGRRRRGSAAPTRSARTTTTRCHPARGRRRRRARRPRRRSAARAAPEAGRVCSATWAVTAATAPNTIPVSAVPRAKFARCRRRPGRRRPDRSPARRRRRGRRGRPPRGRGQLRPPAHCSRADEVGAAGLLLRPGVTHHQEHRHDRGHHHHGQAQLVRDHRADRVVPHPEPRATEHDRGRVLHQGGALLARLGVRVHLLQRRPRSRP